MDRWYRSICVLKCSARNDSRHTQMWHLCRFQVTIFFNHCVFKSIPLRLSNVKHHAYIRASHAQPNERLLLIITVIVCSHNMTNRMKLVFGTPHCRGFMCSARFFSFCFFVVMPLLFYTFFKEIYLYKNKCTIKTRVISMSKQAIWDIKQRFDSHRRCIQMKNFVRVLMIRNLMRMDYIVTRDNQTNNEK